MSLNYTEHGETLFQLSGPTTGCHASLGTYYHWCLGNIHACNTDGFSVGVWLNLLPSNIKSSDVILLTSGGTTPNSNGFYVTRRLGDQLEVGVAQGGSLWRQKFRLRSDDTWIHLAIGWADDTGLIVGVDGVIWLFDAEPTTRTSVTPSETLGIQTGLDTFLQEVTPPCTFSVGHVQMTDSSSDIYTFSQNPGSS